MPRPKLSPTRAFTIAAALLAPLTACDDGGGTTDPTRDATLRQDAAPSDATPTGDATPTRDATPLPDATPDSGPDPDAGPLDPRAALLSVPEAETYTLPGLSGPAYVLRVEAGIPHIYAQTREDLGRVVGFTLARDRYFFMDLQRRLALGRISALLGTAGLATDMDSRLTGMTAVADTLEAHLEPELRAYLAAAAEGVNAYIAAVQAGELPGPSELQIAGPLLGARDPSTLMEPFTVRDFMAMAAVLMYVTNYETDDVGRARKAQLLTDALADPLGTYGDLEDIELRVRGFHADIWSHFRPLFPDASSTPGFGVSGEGDQKRAPDAHLHPDAPLSAPRSRPLNLDLLTRATDRLERFGRRIGRDKRGDFGSNAWAVAGTHSTNGETLVAGDGHLQLSVPALMYQIGLDTTVLGGGDLHHRGMFLSPLPVMAVGTNGRVAWGMVNPVVDITDWYREELQLDADGRPSASQFQGEWRPLVAIDETYQIAAVLGGAGGDQTYPRYETFDGRRILDIEGRPLADDEAPGPGETEVHLGTHRVVPADIDGDGVITALSFDHGALDATHWPATVERMGKAQNIHEYREASRALVGGGLFMAAGDADGNILFSSYQAIPCRGYLQRGPDGYLPGSDPNLILDGTTYGGFRMPTDAQGHIDPEPGRTDPYACVIPFDDMPQAINPAAGHVFTANNDPGQIDIDGDHTNDQHFIGGPWQSVRAASIRDRLDAAINRDAADLAEMASIQADRRSRLGEIFTPYLRQAIARARAYANGDPSPETPAHQRLAQRYQTDAARLDEADQRLNDWTLDTPSGVETFYDQPTDAQRRDAVATMIFNAWLPRFSDAVWRDEPTRDLFPYLSSYTKLAAIRAFLDARDTPNGGGHASHNPSTGESVYFDIVGTPDTETANELMLTALTEALDYLSSAPTGPGAGGFGSPDMNTWLWGLRHMVRFESLLAGFLGDNPQFSLITNRFAITPSILPLAPNIPNGDPRRGLPWFPRGGDNWAVDASSHGFSGTQFTYGNGPVMRTVIGLKDGQITGANIIPGGQSALTNSPHFADQAALWLGNQTLPFRYHLPDVIQGATSRETFTPAD